MTLKTFVRLSAYSLIVGCALVAQKASCLPFWDSGAGYNTANSSNSVNLGGLVNPEGNVWGIVGASNSALVLDVIVSNYSLTYPGLECSGQKVFIFGQTPSSTNYPSERISIHPAMLAGNTYSGVNSGYSISNAYAMNYLDNGSTIYYSFVFQVPVYGALGTGAGFVCGFNSVIGPQAGAITVASARLYIRLAAAGSTNYQIGIGANPSASSTVTFLTNLYNATSTNFVVCAYTFQAGTNLATQQGSNNYAQMWVNPDPSTFGAAVPPPPSATNNSDTGSTGGGTATNQVLSFYFRQGNSAEPLVYAADLRVGLCWACVAPPTNNPAPQADTLSIAASSSNLAMISFQTNTPCYLMQKATNFAYTTNFTTNAVSTSNAWGIITTPPALVGTNFVVTDVTSVTTVTSNVVVGVSTNYTTNTTFPPAFYQVKTYAN